jgi:hypothetical protein
MQASTDSTPEEADVAKSKEKQKSTRHSQQRQTESNIQAFQNVSMMYQ